MTSVRTRQDSNTNCAELNPSLTAAWRGKVVCIITSPQCSLKYQPYAPVLLIYLIHAIILNRTASFWRGILPSAVHI